MSEKNKKADEVWNRWIAEGEEAKKMAVEERTKNRLKVNDPNNKEAFLSWLRARVKHYGYEENNAPDYYSKALKSADPHDLPNSLWTEWTENLENLPNLKKVITNETLTTSNAFFYSIYLVWQSIILALMLLIRWLEHFLQK